MLSYTLTESQTTESKKVNVGWVLEGHRAKPFRLRTVTVTKDSTGKITIIKAKRKTFHVEHIIPFRGMTLIKINSRTSNYNWALIRKETDSILFVRCTTNKDEKSKISKSIKGRDKNNKR